MQRKNARKHDKKYSELYYTARNLYFIAKVLPSNEVDHMYSSSQIRKTLQAEFNVAVPDSTIRRWANEGDKDFESRSWVQEWNRRIAIGVINASKNLPAPEHPFESEQTPTAATFQSPMAALSALKAKALESNVKIAHGTGSLILLLIKEIADDYKRTGKLNLEKLKVLQPFAVRASEYMFGEVKNLEEITKDIDASVKHGKLLPITDPLARERVRGALRTIFDTAFRAGTLQKEIEDAEKEIEGDGRDSESMAEAAP